ncbi:MAG: VPLPA-CTERM sorting domain-containing protein [bacterium]
MIRTILAAALGLGLAGAASASTVVLDDNFDGYAAVDVLNIGANFLGPTWVTTPTLDYIVTNNYGNLCRGTGACIDLDGSTNHAGVLTTVANFAAGTYDLAIQLFGNGRGGSNDSVTITLGTFVLTLNNIASGDDVSQTVHFTTTGGSLSFANAGGDNIGAVLSSVTLTAVPLPAGGLLLLGGLAGLAALRRRKSV